MLEVLIQGFEDGGLIVVKGDYDQSLISALGTMSIGVMHAVGVDVGRGMDEYSIKGCVNHGGFTHSKEDMPPACRTSRKPPIYEACETNILPYLSLYHICMYEFLCIPFL